MQTYVINTSENRNFDSNLLFSLARYEQIQWISCSLNKIKACAEEIFEKEDAKIPFRDYRVVVLVDFFAYPYSVHSENNTSPGDYIEIYKFFIEHYLLTNLFEYLKKQDVPAKYCEIYYIQYTKYEPISQNEKELEQAAQLFGMEKEAAHLKASRLGFDKEASGADQKNKKNDPYQKYERDIPDAEKREKFTLICNNESDPEKRLTLDFPILDITEDTPEENRRATFVEFYNSYRRFHNNDAKKFPITVHEPYETHGNNPVRAAYDTLTLSLYLIHLYERREDISPDQKICSPNPEILEELMIKAYQKIHSARKIAQNDPQNNPCRYYSLRQDTKEEHPLQAEKNDGEADLHIWGRTSDADVFQKPDKNAKNRETALTEERKKGRNIDKYSYSQLYQGVLQYADREEGVPTAEEMQTIDRMMSDYQNDRDLKRDRTSHQNMLGRIRCTEKICPSEEELNSLINEKKAELRSHLEKAISAEYTAKDFSKEKEQAEAIHERYQYLQARLRGKWFFDLLLLIFAVATPVLTYIALQHRDLHYSLFTVLAVISFFTLVFILVFFLRLLPLKWEMRYLKRRMRKVYENCLALNELALEKLKARYEVDLLKIEKLRYDIRLIEHLNELNREKNRHIEMNQIMLERVEDVLVGILNCFHYPHGDTKDVDVRDSFDIEKPFHDPSNTIYRILSIETVDSIFNS